MPLKGLLQLADIRNAIHLGITATKSRTGFCSGTE
jgi:hypothetical protein